MDTKAEKIITTSKYGILELDYLYVLTVQGDTAIVDNIGYHKARALETLHDLHTDKTYKDCFNYLLQGDREIKAWSNDLRIKQFHTVVKRGDENEPAKKPRELNDPIKKGEIFDWFSYTQYRIAWPTKETIDKIRARHWWDSKNKSLFCFYHEARPINSDLLSFYVPKWLAPYNHSYTYKGFNVDTNPLDERRLNAEGLAIRRFIEENADPREHLKKLSLNDRVPEFSHWENSYVRISMKAVVKKPSPESKNAVMTVCLLMPEEQVWEKNKSEFAAKEKLRNC